MEKENTILDAVNDVGCVATADDMDSSPYCDV